MVTKVRPHITQNEQLLFEKSSPGKKDGLYWEAKPDEEESPLGPLVSSAHSEGYGKQDENAPKVRQPFHGYFFKILTKAVAACVGVRGAVANACARGR